MKKNNRPATVYAASLELACPHCGEPVPAPDNGSDQWSPSQVKAAEGEQVCNSCEESFRIVAQSKAIVSPVSA